MGKDWNIFTDLCICRSIKLLEASETDGFAEMAENVVIWTGMIIGWNLREISTLTDFQYHTIIGTSRDYDLRKKLIAVSSLCS
jgi:hypothetical protein